MGKVNHLRNIMNLFLPCFGARQCTCELLTLHAGPVSLQCRTQSKSLHGLYGGGELVQFPAKTRWPPPFTFLVCYLSMGLMLELVY